MRIVEILAALIALRFDSETPLALERTVRWSWDFHTLGYQNLEVSPNLGNEDVTIRSVERQKIQNNVPRDESCIHGCNEENLRYNIWKEDSGPSGLR